MTGTKPPPKPHNTSRSANGWNANSAHRLSEPPARRKISFLPLGSKDLSATGNGEAVAGTSSSFRPDAVRVLSGEEKLEGWHQVLIPLEFKNEMTLSQPAPALQLPVREVQTCLQISHPHRVDRA